MKYHFLSPDLKETAEVVHSYLIENMGLRRVEIEKATIPNVNFRPTLSGFSPRGFMVCVEISNSYYPKDLDILISDCLINDVPVKIFIAKPASKSHKKDETEIRRLSKKGIGLLIVGQSGVEVIRNASELSLFLSNIQLKFIPKKLRATVTEATETYRDGNPVKGVSVICDEIELLIRKKAIKELKKGNIPPSKLNFNKARLANIIDQLEKHTIFSKPFSGKCSVITEIRNDSSHPPRNFQKRQERHKKLKTNFNFSLYFLIDLYKFAR